MAHYALLDENNQVIAVNVINDGDATPPGRWIQTSYTGRIRKNYAGIGYTYDEQRDAFIPPQPYPSWVLHEGTCQWTAPKAYPHDGHYIWNEDTQEWRSAQ